MHGVERCRIQERPGHRERLRPVQIWVPDVRAPSFEAQAHRQSLAVAESSMAYEDQAFIDAISELD